MPTTITSSGITFNDATSQTTSALAAGAIGNTQLASGAVDGTKLSSQSVSYGNLSTDLTKRVVHAWVNFSGATGTIRNSYNVSSVTRYGVGQYRINYTSNTSSANYAFAGICGNGTENPAAVAAESVIVTNTLVNLLQIMTVSHGSNAVDFNWVTAIIFQS